MDQLLLSPQTRRQLEAIIADAPHAIVLVGAAGIGKRTVAAAIASALTTKALVTVVEPDEKGTISIETVRSLYQRTRSRQEGRQVIIIDHAEGMGIEAQNAFLKLLEEPREGVTFILTAPNDDALLPTISSRVQTVGLPRMSQTALQAMVTARAVQLQPQELAQLLFVADGRPGTLARLLDDPQAFEHYKQLMKQAKEMLAASPYERLSLITTLTKSREDAIALLEAMARMLHIQLLRDPSETMLSLAENIQECLARLAQNGNPRAQLTSLFIRN
ncbi:MAG TPA: AAA family ATPase [Candidatus Saccharimonadales bacterium]|nr:AAA family ATPase [Candidatus Saccharimonadales bacterium]